MRLAVVLVLVSGCSFSGHSTPPDTHGAGSDAAGDGSIDGACLAEQCNGVDDDCDGSIDEGFALGAPCDGSDGDACMEGTVVCSADGLATTCSDTSATSVEACANSLDDDCNGFVDCQDAPCCADAACSGGAYCCTGSGLVVTIPNNCVNDFGTSGSSDTLEVYCCDGVSRFCLSGETCPWRTGCTTAAAIAAADTTCSRSGLQTDAMATVTCQAWRGRTTYNCSPVAHAYFP